QRHTRGRDRPGAAPVDRGWRAVARRPSRGGMGRPAGPRPCRGRAPASALPPASGRMRPAMMNLAQYRRRSQCLADFLPWTALVTSGVVLNKDGSFQRTARFRGPDLDSATPAELVATTARLNNALRRLGSGWAIFIEAQRVPANRYPQ